MDREANILVVDDDFAHRTMLQTLLGGWGYRIDLADDGSRAVNMVHSRSYDLVLMDIKMVEMSGLEALEAIRAFNPVLPVLLMTAYSSVETAVEALRRGAHDYLTKPLDFDELKRAIARTIDQGQANGEARAEPLLASLDAAGLIWRSSQMGDLLEMVAMVAPTEATVLISGESGTGKELIASAIHRNSRRHDGPFVTINSAAIPETLMESELFGHEKGAFTGADRRREGRFRQAHGGTLFLDEIGEMAPAMQPKLLRVIQEKEFQRVGGGELVRVDVRLVAATNRDLKAQVQEGSFREDLYYRLNVVSLRLPPLRSRNEDIPLLAEHFLRIFSKKNAKEIKGFTPRAMDRMVRHGWPGNVRELINVVERGVVLCRGTSFNEDDLPPALREGEALSEEAPPPPEGGLPLEEVEREAILQTLEAAGGNKSEAARRLGITRRTLHKKLKKYGKM